VSRPGHTTPRHATPHALSRQLVVTQRRYRAHGGRQRAKWTASFHVIARAPPPVAAIIAENQYGSKQTTWLAR